MTDKADIEMVAREIHESQEKNRMLHGHVRDEWEDLAHEYHASLKMYAQAAITSLETKYHLVPKEGVVVLDKGAEPEVGDFIEMPYPFDSFHVVDEWQIQELLDTSTKWKIAKRANKPAIMKEGV